MIYYVAFIAAVNIFYIVWSHNRISKLAGDDAKLKWKASAIAWPLVGFNAVLFVGIIAATLSFMGDKVK